MQLHVTPSFNVLAESVAQQVRGRWIELTNSLPGVDALWGAPFAAVKQHLADATPAHRGGIDRFSTHRHEGVVRPCWSA